MGLHPFMLYPVKGRPMHALWPVPITNHEDGIITMYVEYGFQLPDFTP